MQQVQEQVQAGLHQDRSYTVRTCLGVAAVVWPQGLAPAAVAGVQASEASALAVGTPMIPLLLLDLPTIYSLCVTSLGVIFWRLSAT